jgi:RNA polymerase sigma-70 factor (ECF subfamily)
MPTTAGELFERYHVQTYRYFLRLTGSVDVAKDLTQELFLRVLKHLRSCPPGFEGVWVFRIARNLLIDYWRKDPHREVALARARRLERDATQVVAFSLNEALDLLSPDDRELFLQRELSGLSHAELAAMRDMTAENVRSRLCRIRCRLKALLRPRLSANENRRRNGDE